MQCQTILCMQEEIKQKKKKGISGATKHKQVTKSQILKSKCQMTLMLLSSEHTDAGCCGDLFSTLLGP